MKTARIKIPVYDGYLIIYKVAAWDQLKKKLLKVGNLSDLYCASTFTNHKKSGGTEYIVAFRGNPTNQTIVHETVHLVNLIFRDRGVKLKTNNDEAQAYFTDWTFNEIEKFLTKTK